MKKAYIFLICMGLFLILPFLSAVTIEDTTFKDNLLYVNASIIVDRVLVNSSFGYVEFYNLTTEGNFSNNNATGTNESVNVTFLGTDHALMVLDLLWDNGTILLDISDINVTIPPNRYVNINSSAKIKTDYPQTIIGEILNTVSKSSSFFRKILGYFNLNNIVDRIASFFRNLIDNFNITSLVDKLLSVIRKIVDTFNLNNLIEKTSSMIRKVADTFNFTNITDRIGSFIRKVVDNFNLNNIIEGVGSFIRKIVDNFNLNNLLDRAGGLSVVRKIVDNFEINSLTERVGSFVRKLVDNFNLNNIIDRTSSFFRDLSDNFGISTITERVGSFVRTIVDTFNLNNLTERVGSFVRKIVDNFTLNNIIDRTGNFFRNLIDNFTFDNIVEKTSSFFRKMVDTFTFSNLVERTANFFRNLVDNFGISTITEKLASSIRNIIDNFGISTITERVGSFVRKIVDNFTLNNIIDRTGNFFRNLIDNFNLNNILDRAGGLSVVRKIVDNFTFANIVDRTGSFFRKVVDNFGISTIIERIGSYFRKIVDNFGINNLVEKTSSMIRKIVDSFVLNNIVDKVGSFFRNLSDTFSISTITERVGSFFRNIVDNFTLNNIIIRTRGYTRNIIQFFQMLFSLFTKGTYIDWNWVTSSETLTQGQAYEGLRVPYGLFDNWTSDVPSPQNWINVTKTYTLPVDCGNVQIQIEEVNRTYSVLVNNTACVYTVINNNTITPGSSSNITINYTTGATTSSEGDWIASNKRIGNQTHWINTLTLSNPSIHNYIDIATNITDDSVALPAFVNITNATNTEFTHNFSNINGNVNWSLDELDTLENYVFTSKYRTDNITLTKTNHTETILGKDYDIWNITIEANSTRPILNVYSYFNFSDVNVVANRLYKCVDGLVNCTDEEITSRVDVVWEDHDSDGDFDYVEFFVSNLTQSQSYKLYNDKGFPVEISESKTITNSPIYIFDNILWESTLTMYNPNAFATEKVYKYEFPLGSADIELDDISKNLEYPTTGGIAPYVTIIDKDDSVHPTSVYLSPGETKTFIINYRTESVTLDSSTYFPSYFVVGEPGLISQVLRLKNQAEDDLNNTIIQYRIPIDYAEDLIVCEGDYGEHGCEEDTENPEYLSTMLDTQSSVNGDYILEIDQLNSGETMYITLSYKTKTAKVVSIEKGRRSVGGNLTVFKLITYESQSKFTIGDLRYKDAEIPCENIKDILKCRPASGICDIPIGYSCNPLTVKLNTLGIGEQSKFYIWYVEQIKPEEDNWFDNIFNWFVENIWNSGKRIELEKGSVLYYSLRWISSQDQNGNYFVPIYRLIILGSGVGIILIIVGWRHFRKKKNIRKKNRQFGNLREEIRNVKDKISRKV